MYFYVGRSEMYKHYLHEPRTSRELEALRWEAKLQNYITGTEELNEHRRSVEQHGVGHTLQSSGVIMSAYVDVFKSTAYMRTWGGGGAHL
jgi:hypothetical protein